MIFCISATILPILDSRRWGDSPSGAWGRQGEPPCGVIFLSLLSFPRKRGGVPMGSHARRAGEVADIFIPLARNENSAMTVGGVLLVFGLCSLLARGWIVPVGDSIPDRREAELRGTHSQAELGNDRGGR